MQSSKTFFAIFVGWIFIIAVVCGDNTSTTPAPSAAPYGTVSFFSAKIFKGYSYGENYTPGCHKIMPYFRGNLESVNTNGKCIRVYQSRVCGDDESYKVINVGTPSHHDLSGVSWTSGSSSLTLLNTINSWKPCSG